MDANRPFVSPRIVFSVAFRSFFYRSKTGTLCKIENCLNTPTNDQCPIKCTKHNNFAEFKIFNKTIHNRETLIRVPYFNLLNICIVF